MRRLENEYLLVEAADHGAELQRIYDKTTGRELLWDGDPAFWSYRSPVLFPFVGKLNNGEFRHHGITYKMESQHGFARTSDFTFVREGDNYLTFALESDEETRQKYPFDFRLAITYTLEGRKLRVGWEVFNLSENHHMYFSIGAHPAFRVPVNEGEKKEDYYVSFEGNTDLKYILIDPKGGANVENKYQLETEEGFLKLRKHLFDIDTYIFEKGQIRDVSLCTPDKKPYLTVHCAGFPFFGMWTKSDEAPFVCLEPWYGRLDDRGFDGGLSEKKGIQVLTPMSSFRADYTIEVRE